MIEKDWTPLIVALANKAAKKYESVGITNVTFNSGTSSFVFELADGSTSTVVLNISAQGVSFTAGTSGLSSSNVQSALVELQQNIESAVASELLKDIADENLTTSNVTTAQFLTALVAKDYHEGTILSGEVLFSDLPSTLSNGELVAELRRKYGNTQVWHLELTSTNTADYIWTLEYNSSSTSQTGNTWNERPTKDYVDDQDIDYVGREQQIDFEGTLSGTTITYTLENSISAMTLRNNTGYLVYAKLPVTTLTGDLPNNYTMLFKDKDNNDIILNCIHNTNTSTTSNVGQMCQIQRYDVNIGYEWQFYVHYSEYDDNGTTRRVFYTDTVTSENNGAMTGQDIYNAVINTNLKVGSVVKATSTYTSGSYTYEQGHNYLVNGSWTGGALAISTQDITVIPTNTVLQLTNQQMLDATTDGGFANLQIVTPKDDNGYFVGVFYQMHITENEGTTEYEWTIINKTLPIGSSVIMGDQNSLQISDGGTYVILGDITTLTITATDPVTITVCGTIGSLTLPSTTNTVLIRSTGYNGATPASNTPLVSGSILGAHTYGLIAER